VAYSSLLSPGVEDPSDQCPLQQITVISSDYNSDGQLLHYRAVQLKVPVWHTKHVSRGSLTLRHATDNVPPLQHINHLAVTVALTACAGRTNVTG
jgi:hypothetical protein